MNRSSLSLKGNARGASLVVSLIFLVVMAMIGITVANVSLVEERMAGGSRDRELALQATEAALRDAEIQLADTTFRSQFAITFNATNANDADYWETCFTASPAPAVCAKKFGPSSTLPGGLAAPPQYIVERKNDEGSGPFVNVYRVTARGVGGTADAIVVLQAEFSFTP